MKQTINKFRFSPKAYVAFLIICHLSFSYLIGQNDTLVWVEKAAGAFGTGIYSESSGRGFSAYDNLTGYYARSCRDGFYALENGDDGFEANFNAEDGFFSHGNWHNGFLAKYNRGDGFRCESTGFHAGYFVNNDSTKWPSVYIAHGHDDSTDLKFGGRALITSESQRFDFIGGIQTHKNSVLGGLDGAQLLLYENENDFARLRITNDLFDASTNNRFWDIAGRIGPDTSGSNDRLNFYMHGFGDVLSLRGNGKVGINDNSPNVELVVRQQSNPSFSFDGGIGSDAGIQLFNANGSADEALLFLDNTGSLIFGFNDIQRAYINPATGDYINSSDVRLKKNIRSMPKVLDKVSELKPSLYLIRGQEDADEQIGFIAQEIEQVFPEVVSEVNDMKGVAYSQVAVIAIKAIQELVEENQQLRDRLHDIESELEALKMLITISSKKD